jgi:hypothetical protein
MLHRTTLPAALAASMALALGACDGGGPKVDADAPKKAHEAAIAELKQPVAIISIYLEHIQPIDTKEPYLPKRRPDAEKAAAAAANEIRHAANGVKQRIERGDSPATKDLVTALSAVATSCAEASEPEQLEKCNASVKALDAALDKANTAAGAAGAAGKYPRVGPEAITEEAKKKIAPLLKTRVPGPAEKDYIAKRKDPNAAPNDVLTACQGAQQEVDAMTKAYEKADEPIRLVAVTHKMSMDSQCNGMTGVDNLRQQLEECKKPKNAKTPECKLTCSKVKVFVDDGFPAAAFTPMAKEFEEVCEEKKK